jgi:hypothetical protein
MKKTQILPIILVAVLGVGGYLFKDKFFSEGNITTYPVADLPTVKASIVIDSVNEEKVSFRLVLEAKQAVDLTALRAYYYEKGDQIKKDYEYDKPNSRKTVSNELGELDLSSEKIELKAGEKKEIRAYFVASEISNTHYIQITGNADEACPPEMSTEDCLERQMAQMGKDDKNSKIRLLEKVRKK